MRYTYEGVGKTMTKVRNFRIAVASTRNLTTKKRKEKQSSKEPTSFLGGG